MGGDQGGGHSYSRPAGVDPPTHRLMCSSVNTHRARWLDPALRQPLRDARAANRRVSRLLGTATPAELEAAVDAFNETCRRVIDESRRVHPDTISIGHRTYL